MVRRAYRQEFRDEAVRLVGEHAMKLRDVANGLGCSYCRPRLLPTD